MTASTQAPAAGELAEAPGRPGGRLPAGLAPLGSRAYRYLLTGTSLTMGAFFMQLVAQGWLIYELTSSSTWLGIVSFANGIPMLLLSLPAGVLVDRLDRRKVVAVAQWLTAAVILVLTVLVWMELAQPWHVAVLSFVTGTIFVVIVPARLALITATVDRAQLGSAIALSSTGTNLGRVVGPSLAGLVIAVFGVAAAFGVQMVAYAIAALSTSRIPQVAVDVRAREGSPYQSLLEGLAYIWRDPTVFALFTLQAIPAFLIMPFVQLLPIIAKDVLNAGPEGLGTLMMAMGIGAMGGSMAVAMLPARRQGVCLLVFLAAFGLLLCVLATSTSLVLSIVVMALLGAAQAAYVSMNGALVQIAVPDRLQGRVMAAYVTTWGLMPTGALPQGVLAEWFGAPAVMAGAAVLSLVLVLVMAVRSPGIRKLSRQAQ